MSTIKEQIETMDNNAVIAAYEHTGSVLGTMRYLGVLGHSRHTQIIMKKKLQTIDPEYHQKFSGRSRYTIEEVKCATKTAMCMSDVLRKLGLSTHGTNADTIYNIIKQNSINISHFDVTRAMQRNKHRWTKEDIFVENSPIPRSTVNRQVRNFNILGDEACSECGISTMYNGKPIRLTVDHKNGINDDNRPENLRWLCHNCHSQTDDFQGKGKVQKRN